MPDALHASAVALLNAWQPPDTEQDAARLSYLNHLALHDDALLRSCREGHLTASSLIVDPSRHAVLLTLHPLVGRWLQTGGHCESTDADINAAAAREAREESSIRSLSLDPDPLRLDRHAVRCRSEAGEATVLHHLDVQFLAIAPAGAQERRTEESTDLRWWP